jgi:hypothetical protein
MEKPMTDHTVTLDAETADKLRKLTKNELIEKFAVAALEAETYKLRCRTATETEKEALNEVESLKKRLHVEQAKLDKAGATVEQGRAMIEAIMERWYEYDA